MGHRHIGLEQHDRLATLLLDRPPADLLGHLEGPEASWRDR